MHIGFHTAVGIHISTASHKSTNNLPLAICLGFIGGLISHLLFDKIQESNYGGFKKMRNWQEVFMLIYLLCGGYLVMQSEYVQAGLYLLGFLSGNLPDITDTNFYTTYFNSGKNKQKWFCHKNGYASWYGLSVKQDKIINIILAVSIIILTLSQ